MRKIEKINSPYVDNDGKQAITVSNCSSSVNVDMRR